MWTMTPYLVAPKDSLYNPKHTIPMATYAEITAFTLFEQGDLDFKLVFKATQIIEELDQGRLIDQLLLLNRLERLLCRISSNASKTNGAKILVSLLQGIRLFGLRIAAIFKAIIIYDTISVSGWPYGRHSVPSLGPIKMSLPSILPTWIALIMVL
jgi:hypothetical protein